MAIKTQYTLPALSRRQTGILKWNCNHKLQTTN